MASDSVGGGHLVRGSDYAVPVMQTHASPNFPLKLHDCLTELERDGLSHIAGFQPHGRCIMVRKPHEFVAQVLPRWFSQTKYASFQRQLNIYGFQRIAAGPDKHGYHHPAFLRGRPELVAQISRMGIKGTGPRQPANTVEPNFYSRPFVTDHEPDNIPPVVPPVAVAVVPPVEARAEPSLGAVLRHSLPLPVAPTGQLYAVPSPRAAPWTDSVMVHTMVQRQRDQLVPEQQHEEQRRHRELQQLMQQPRQHPLQQLVAQQRQRELQQVVQQQQQRQLQQLVEEQRHRELQQLVEQQRQQQLEQLVGQQRQQQLQELVEQQRQQLVGQQRQQQLQELVGQQRHREMQQLASSSLAPANLGHTPTQIALQAPHASVGNAPPPPAEQLNSDPSQSQLLLCATLLGAFRRQDM